jgi:hypothetical protein
LDHHLLYGNKKESLHEDFRPYQNDEKNLQYEYQKCLQFDIPELKAAFLEKFPELKNAYNWWYSLKQIKAKRPGWNVERLSLIRILGQKTYKDCISLFSKCIDFHNHIFKASEQYGRIYMPFHTLPKDFRHCLRYVNKKGQKIKIKELFDLKCCFVQLAALLAQNGLDKNDPHYERKLEQFKAVKELAENDIYTDIKNTIGKTELTRDKIKKHIMEWLFSTSTQRTHSTNPVIKQITQYFKQKFPDFYQFITRYKKTVSNNRLKTSKKAKKISKLSIDCFQFETQLFFDNIIPNIKPKLDPENPVILSLHDGIYILDTKHNQNITVNSTRLTQSLNPVNTSLTSFEFIDNNYNTQNNSPEQTVNTDNIHTPTFITNNIINIITLLFDAFNNIISINKLIKQINNNIKYYNNIFNIIKHYICGVNCLVYGKPG